MPSDYVCAISGKEARETDLVLDAAEDDDLDALPVGWVAVTVRRRGINPAWVALQNTKARVLAQVLAQMATDGATDEERAIAQADAGVLVAAQFYGIDSDTPKYRTEAVDLVIRNPDEDKGVADEWAKIAEVLGFSPAVAEPAGV